MSDMSSDRITIRVPKALSRQLRGRSRTQGRTESQLVRQALENYLGQPDGEQSAYDLADQTGLIGSVKNMSKDLSTSRRHFEGFGRRK